jgi:uncharacterized protein (DUF2249 family)
MPHTIALPARPWPATAEVELDVRDDLRNGREPFSRIRAAVAALGPTQVLHLRTIFEPIPLYRVLGNLGFAALSHAHAPDDWSIWFHRGDAATASPPPPAAVAPGEAPPFEAPPALTLDVRGLTPPEPLQRTLAALETLAPGDTLLQINDRVPQFLLPLLHERGHAYTIDETHADGVRVLIRRSS